MHKECHASWKTGKVLDWEPASFFWGDRHLVPGRKGKCRGCFEDAVAKSMINLLFLLTLCMGSMLEAALKAMDLEL
jgi:hypothetical protein